MKTVYSNLAIGATMALASAFMAAPAAAQQYNDQQQSGYNAPSRDGDGDNLDENKSFYFGIKGAFNLTNFYRGELSDRSLRPGWAGGVFMRTAIADFLWVQPELLYTTKGTRSEYGTPVLGYRATQFNLHYLEVPVLLKLHPTKTFNVNFGPYGSYLVQANLTDSERDEIIPDNETKFSRNSFNQLDWGVVGGLEFNLKNVDIGARYSVGFRDVAATNQARQLTQNGRNNNLQLYVGFVF